MNLSPELVKINGKIFVAVRTYECAGRRFFFIPPEDDQLKRLERNKQRSLAHQANRNWRGIHEEAAEVVALWITPEGADPREKDIDAFKEEVLNLPYGFVISVLVDILEMAEEGAKRK